jgi:hypothetical protein
LPTGKRFVTGLVANLPTLQPRLLTIALSKRKGAMAQGALIQRSVSASYVKSVKVKCPFYPELHKQPNDH